MKNKIYPAIYRAVDDNEYLYANKDNYYSYERSAWDKSDNCDNHENDKNITREYLANTYGKVESKEHAEFIFDLGDINNLSSRTGYTEEYPSWFCFDDDELFFFDNESDANYNGEKLITIPLPPKQIQTATSEEEFEMQQIMKNNGDNLVLGCEDSKREEWPCVGDKFIHKGELVTCISKGVMSKGDEVITFEGADKLSHGSCWNIDAWVKKPKTPEEELRDEIELIIKESIDEDYSPSANAEHITGEILSKYNITKKPQ